MVSTPINQAVIQIGRETRRDFNTSCSPLDWQPFDITFPMPFPTKDVRVIVTANDFDADPDRDNNPVVGVVEDLTPVGFRLWGRNPFECVRSFAGFNWMAVAETPGREHHPDIDLRMGVVQPRFFWGRCLGNPLFWRVNFGPRRTLGAADNLPIVLATANNLNTWATTTEAKFDGGPVHAQDWEPLPTAATVAVVQRADPTGFFLKAWNADMHWGNCAFYHVALAHTTSPGVDLFVETGRVGAKQFQPRDNEGDWRLWDVPFTDPFLTPPTVLVTANDLMDDGSFVPDRGPGNAKAVAAVGTAQNVTTHGFTLKARNSDCGDGFAGFHWVALGCSRFCA
jgi:hypothetical protein